MSVKQAQRVQDGRYEKEKTKKIKKLAIRQGTAFLLGAVLGMSGFNGEFSPFGVAFAGACPVDTTLSASFGAVLGAFLTLPSLNALRYFASVLAVAVMMLSLKPFKKVVKNSLCSVLAVSVSLSVTGLAMVFAGDISPIAICLCLAESIIGGGSAYLFKKTIDALNTRGGVFSFTYKETTSALISAMLLALAFKDFSVLGVHPLNIAVLTALLICANYCHEAGGAILGICGGLTVSFGNANMFYMALYSFGGLVSGVFSSFGKVFTYVSFVLTCFGVTALFYEEINIIALAIEVGLSGLLYFLITLKFGEGIKRVLRPGSTSGLCENIKNDLYYRLKNASQVSSEISMSLNDVNSALEKAEKGDITRVMRKTKDRVCGSCGLYDNCWEQNGDFTADAFNTLLTLKKEGKYLEYKTVPAHFAGKCIRTENVASSFNRLYGEYVSYRKNHCRIHEMNSAAARQFFNVSALLDSLKDGVSREKSFDVESGRRIKNSAQALGIEAAECVCTYNNIDKCTVELTVNNKSSYCLRELGEEIENLTKRHFSLPKITKEGDFSRIVYKEENAYRVSEAIYQTPARGEKYSGDTLATFEDDDGNFYALLCDGMGTGIRAALASALAVSLTQRLIKGGFGINAAVNTVNTALISKSGEECSVSLDLLQIDLNTGYTKFYKCGASNTMVKKNGKVYDVSVSSLPLGILSDTEIGCGTGTVKDGDMLILGSDGFWEDNVNYVKKSLKGMKNEDIKGFVNSLGAHRNQSEGENSDDVSVIGLLILK